MGKVRFISFIGLLALLVSSCAAENTTTASSTTASSPTASSSTVSSPTVSSPSPNPSGKPPFSTSTPPLVIQQPAKPVAVPNLIPATNANDQVARIQRQAKQRSKDPFSVIPAQDVGVKVTVTPLQIIPKEVPKLPTFPLPPTVGVSNLPNSPSTSPGNILPPSQRPGVTRGRAIVVEPISLARPVANRTRTTTTTKPATKPATGKKIPATANKTKTRPTIKPLPVVKRPTVPVLPPPVVTPTFKPVLPTLPEPTLAKAVEITGVIQVGGVIQAIIKAPNEPSSRYIRVGDRLSNGQVLVKRIEMNEGSSPVVILEQYGIEVARRVGDPVQSTGRPTASLPLMPESIAIANIQP